MSGIGAPSWSRIFSALPQRVARMADTIQLFVTDGEALLDVMDAMQGELSQATYDSLQLHR